MNKLSWYLAALALFGCGGVQKSSTSSAGAPGSLGADRFLVQQTQAPVVEIRVMFEAGSVDDPAGKEGLTYVTVASMLEGDAGGVSYAERARRLFPMAAEISGHVEREEVVFSARVHHDHWAAFYPLFRDVLLAPGFTEADFERVRARALASLTQDLRGSNDEGLGKDVLQQMLFEGHPLAHPELGSETGLGQLKAADLSAHWQRVFCAKRVRIGLSGALAPEIQRQMAADFGRLATAQCTEPTKLAEASHADKRRVWLIEKSEAASVAMSLGVPISVTRAHADYPALMLAAAYLGQHRTFAGRLMQKMRADRGLNYGDYAYAEHFVQDGYSRFPLPNVGRHQQYFSVWIRPVQPEQAHFALRMAIRELETFARDGLSAPDFERIQRFIERYYALFAQTAQQRLGNLLDDAFYHVPGPYLDELRAQIHALTRDDVNEAIKRHFDPQKLQIALVVPQAQKMADALVKGEPSPIVYASEKPKEILQEDTSIASYPLNLTKEQLTIVPVAQVFK